MGWFRGVWIVWWGWISATGQTPQGMTVVLAFLAYILKMLLTKATIGREPALKMLKPVGSDFAFMAITFSISKTIGWYDPRARTLNNVPGWYMAVFLGLILWWWLSWTVTKPGEKDRADFWLVSLSAAMGLLSYFCTVLVVFG